MVKEYVASMIFCVLVFEKLHQRKFSNLCTYVDNVGTIFCPPSIFANDFVCLPFYMLGKLMPELFVLKISSNK